MSPGTGSTSNLSMKFSQFSNASAKTAKSLMFVASTKDGGAVSSHRLSTLKSNAVYRGTNGFLHSGNIGKCCFKRELRLIIDVSI